MTLVVIDSSVVGHRRSADQTDRDLGHRRPADIGPDTDTESDLQRLIRRRAEQLDEERRV